MRSHDPASGRLIKAPENFIGPEGVRQVFREGKAGRRDFVRGAFAAAAPSASNYSNTFKQKRFSGMFVSTIPKR